MSISRQLTAMLLTSKLAIAKEYASQTCTGRQICSLTHPACVKISLTRTRRSPALPIPALIPHDHFRLPHSSFASNSLTRSSYFMFSFKRNGQQVIVGILVSIMSVALKAKGTADCPQKHIYRLCPPFLKGPICQRKCCLGWCAC